MKTESNLLMSTLMTTLAPRHGVNADEISAVINGSYPFDFRVTRYTNPVGKDKFLIIFGKPFLDAMKSNDVDFFILTIGKALDNTKIAESMEIKTPVLLVSDKDFHYEYVLRAQHRKTGVVITDVSDRHDVLSAKSRVHEEMTTILSQMVQS